MEITFDQLPHAVSRLYTKLEDIERLLQKKNEPQNETDRWLDLNELCEYLISRQSLQFMAG